MKYLADDGTVFDHLADCTAHEAAAEVVEASIKDLPAFFAAEGTPGKKQSEYTKVIRRWETFTRKGHLGTIAGAAKANDKKFSEEVRGKGSRKPQTLDPNASATEKMSRRESKDG